MNTQATIIPYMADATTPADLMHRLRFPLGVTPPSRDCAPCPRLVKPIAQAFDVEIGLLVTMSTMVVIGDRADEAVEALILAGWVRSCRAMERRSDGRLEIPMVSARLRGEALRILTEAAMSSIGGVRSRLALAIDGSDVDLNVDGALDLSDDESVRSNLSRAIEIISEERRARADEWIADQVDL